MSPECEPNEALKRASFGSEDPSGPHAHPNPEPLLNASPQAQNPRRRQRTHSCSESLPSEQRSRPPVPDQRDQELRVGVVERQKVLLVEVDRRVGMVFRQRRPDHEVPGAAAPLLHALDHERAVVGAVVGVRGDDLYHVNACRPYR